MSTSIEKYDIVIIGSGPAGHNAAVTAGNAGARVLVIERERKVGGSCVQYGTIPSKTLRETAVTLSAFKRRSGGVYNVSQAPSLQVASLMTRLNQVVSAHQKTSLQHLDQAGVERRHGHASFASPHEICIRGNRGEESHVQGQAVIVATGSRPRTPTNVPVDHENILDSDSILSMAYLPQSLTVFGGGVIASEYAATFASLGVRVVMIDRYPKPLGFLDPDLVDVFVEQFTRSGGVFVGNSQIDSVHWDGVSKVVATLQDGTVVTSDKALVAQGRTANTDGLNLVAAGIGVNDRGLIDVNKSFQTNVPSVYAVGDTIGPPALASSSMEQGRKAAQHALGIGQSRVTSAIPMGIYTIPEMASVGLDERQARKTHGDILVGRAEFQNLARGQIMAAPHGLLKLISDQHGTEILGVQIVGDGATELIHLGQVAMRGALSIEELSCAIFNFPTLAEAYRLATLDILNQKEMRVDSSEQDPSEASEDPETVASGF